MIEMIKRVVADMLNMQAKTQYGTITAFNPADYTVKAMLQPEGLETGWIPLSAAWTGQNMGAVFGPMIGTDCRIDFVGGVAEAAMAGGRFFNANFRPPVVQSGQCAIIDAAGSFARLNNDGTITFSASVGITSTTPLLKQVGNMEVTGNLQVDKSISATQNISASQNISALLNITATGDMADQGGAKTMAAMRSAYNAHNNGVGTTTPSVLM